MMNAAGPDCTEIAARNNADWCVTIWRAHGLPVRRIPGLVFCPAPTPLFYPNAVTVSRDADPEVLAAFIADLRVDADDPAFSVKDSFAMLDLADAGLSVLLDAVWIYRQALDLPELSPRLDWRRAQSVQALSDWASAWNAAPADAAPIFPENLLAESRTIFGSGFDAHAALHAGGIGHDAAGVMGLSNLFGDWCEAVSGMAALAPGRALVGYESGESLKYSQSLGFQPVGALRVWTP